MANLQTSSFEALKRRQKARNIWQEFTEWLRLHPSPRWVFRGQSQNWPLKPTVGRSKKFLPEKELLLLNFFKRSALPFVSSALLQNNWDWLSVAQHHGLPTRLIDWTTNPLAAAFFATEASARGKKDGVIIAVRPRDLAVYKPEQGGEIAPFEISKPGFFYPSALASRIIAQRGLFSRSNTDKFIVPADVKEDIRRILFSVGVDHAQLMADLDGISNTLRWRYENGVAFE